MKAIVVVCWHNLSQKERFCEVWQIYGNDERVHFQHDKDKEGCGVTKNKGVEDALKKGAEVVIICDDDIFPLSDKGYTAPHCLDTFISDHLKALEPQEVELYEAVTDPPSRGTPYYNRSVKMPVAASMGFWTEVGDYDAPGQLVHGATHPMTFRRETMFWRFFPFSGMNCAFKAEFWPHFKFDEEHGRFDDILMGYRLQREAYRRFHCINLNGPLVRHSRQSNVWHNLRVEAEHMEFNETAWRDYVK